MNKKSLKVMSGIIAVLAVLSLSSCGQPKEEVSQNGDNSVKWITAYSKPKDHDLVIGELNKLLKEKTGATIDLKVIDSGAYAEKMNLMISSNEQFDVCFTSDWQNPYVPNVKKGAYLKLDELLENTPELKASIPEYVWESARTNGGIYGIPNYQVMFKRIDALIQPQLVEKYNIDFTKVSKFEDLEPVLKTIKENEPKMIAFTPSWTTAQFNYEYFSGDVYGDKAGSGKFVPIYEIKEYREYLDLVHDWYKKGYIASDIMTDSGSTPDSLKAVTLGTYKPGVEESEMASRGFVNVRSAFTKPYISATASHAALNAISINSKNPELALKVIEALNTDKDIYNMLCFGIEGKHYEKIGENQVKRLNEDYVFNTGWRFGNQFNAYLTDNQATDTWDATVKMNDESEKSPYMGFSFDVENVKNEIASVNAVNSEYSNFLNYGVEDPALHWDTYVKKLKDAGIDKIVEEITNQYNEWRKTK